jgi:adenylate kinase
MIGAPGAGKGTQARRLAEELGLLHLSTGELFREAVRDDTPLGGKVRSYVEKGALVPDDLTVAMVEERLDRPDADAGAILDGFPRTRAQAQALDRILADQGREKVRVIALVVADDELRRRILARGEGRADDTEEAVVKRLDVYRRDTAPVLEHYAAQVVRVDGIGSMDEITARIQAALGGAK